jgi:molybdopterin converting factor small subunit
MVEPESHTLRVLVEFRNEFKEFKTEIAKDLAEIKDRVQSLTQALAGEMAANRYVNGGVERRLADIETRLSALEQVR